MLLGRLPHTDRYNRRLDTTGSEAIRSLSLPKFARPRRFGDAVIQRAAGLAMRHSRQPFELGFPQSIEQICHCLKL